jgi:STE24 endopeptidase
VEAVLAHELGHFKHRHVLQKRMVGIFGLSLAGLALLGWLAGQSGFYAGLGVAPNLAAPTTRWRCCCSCWRCRPSASSSRR